MWQNLRTRLGARDGFTLIELVVVVAILGLLALIVTPKVVGAIDNAKTNSEKSSTKQIQVAMERYFAEKGTYPAVSLCKNAVNSSCKLSELKPELKNYINLDASIKEDLVYKADTTAGTYELTVEFDKSGNKYKITADSIGAP